MCWLIFKKKLWTQDRIMRWNHLVTGSMNLMCCLLCQSDLETHEHLFFECSYSKSVWHKVRHKVEMNSVKESWEEISASLITKANSKSVFAVASRLVVAAAAYSIWSERNARFFSNRLRPPEQLADRIVSTVRTKLFSFRYKQTSNVKRFMEAWKLDKADFLEED
ncbi:putative reverse transcriptase zinc-binding domain-containing protein [Helianthus annuus]|nr:putative reverse transcriptase zinc-binding domain-containing protein [Helianthus annuus]